MSAAAADLYGFILNIKVFFWGNSSSWLILSLSMIRNLQELEVQSWVLNSLYCHVQHTEKHSHYKQFCGAMYPLRLVSCTVADKMWTFQRMTDTLPTGNNDLFLPSLAVRNETTKLM